MEKEQIEGYRVRAFEGKENKKKNGAEEENEDGCGGGQFLQSIRRRRGDFGCCFSYIEKRKRVRHVRVSS